MSDTAHFESRTGRVKCSGSEVFGFVSDLRNFEQFVPAEAVKNWKAEAGSCSFDVPMPGTVSVRIAEKIPYSKVAYRGDALKKEDFLITLNISQHGENEAEVKVSLDADLNPMLKMIASKPINQFLDVLIVEMEKFTGWKNIR